MLSGATALAYEIVWARQLLLVVGTTTAAVCTVLGVFMVGLGLGAWLLGPLADRSRAPLRLYGWLEGAVGLYALLLPILLSNLGTVYVPIARSLEGQPLAVMLVRVALAFALLLPPTLLMGGTFPVLLRHVATSEARLGRELGVLYAANLVGAAAGAVLTGFVLVRNLGLSGTTTLAACVNLGVGVAAVALGRGSLAPTHDAGAAEPGAAAAALDPSFRRVLWCLVFLSGLAGMAYEVIWTRILLFTFGSTVYSFTVILATFLIGLALGSLVCAFGQARWNPRRALGLAQIGAGTSAALLVPTGPWAADVIESLSRHLGHSASVYFTASALSAALLMLVPATLMGIVLPLSMRLLVDDLARSGRRVGAAYLLNTLGSLLGSFGAGFLLLPQLGLTGALLLLAALQAASGWAALWLAPRTAWRWWLPAGTAALIALGLAGNLALLRGPSPFDPLLRHGADDVPVVEAHSDGSAASVSVVRRSSGRSLHIDGFVATTTQAQSRYMAMMTHIPMLLHAGARRLLVICFGTGSTAGTGLLYPDATIDAVDIDPTVFRFAPLFRDVNRGVAESPRARLIVDDGRNFLLTTEQRYDVITLEPMPPLFAGVVNLYSREYYLLARERLLPGGLIVQWLPMHLADASESLAILRTVQSVFPETTLWLHSETGIIVASRDQPVQIDLRRIEGRLERPGLREDLAHLDVANLAEFVRLYVIGPRAIRRLTLGAGLITDDHPSLEFHRPRHRAPWMLGGRPATLVQALEAFYRERGQDGLPLAGARPAEERALGDARVASNHALLGDLYAASGSSGRARSEYEAGLGKATDDQQRALFLFALAITARNEGRMDEALRFVDAGLALAPASAAGRQLRESLLTRLAAQPPDRSGSRATQDRQSTPSR